MGEAAEAVGGPALLLELEEELLALCGRGVVLRQLLEEGVELFLHLARPRERADVVEVLPARRAARGDVGLHVRVQLGRALGQELEELPLLGVRRRGGLEFRAHASTFRILSRQPQMRFHTVFLEYPVAFVMSARLYSCPK